MSMATIYEITDEQTYQAEISQCVGVTSYHQWFFLSAIAEAFNCEFRAFAVDSGGERLGVAPLLFRRRGPVSTVNFLPVGPTGPLLRGEVLRAGRIGELIRGLGPVLRRHRTVAARWEFSPEIKVNTEDLTAQGFEVFEWESFVIPANKSVDDCWKAMSTGRRQSIRQTEARGVVVEDSLPEEIAQWFPEQMSELYARQGRLPLYSGAVARSLAGRLASDPRMLWRTAKTEDGTVLGMTASVIGDERLWGWQIVGPSVRGMSPHTLLHWDSFKWSVARGLAYDMGGVPHEGIRVIKASLGAESETGVGAFRFHPGGAYKAATALRNWGPVRDNWGLLRGLMGF
jgi:Acetyltransferase (GNAT) domain